MKEIFFKGVAVAVVLSMAGGLVYMLFHGLYTLFSDWKLQQELQQIERESVARRRQRRAAQAQEPGGSGSADTAFANGDEIL
jgi:hypothetical protein